MQGYDWLGVLVNWFPIVLIMGVWILFVRRMQGGGGYYKNLMAVQKEHAEQARRMADALERLAAAAEKRGP